MRLQDIIFNGMDIPSEAQKLFFQYMNTDNMTEDEEKAFRFGATEAFRAVRDILDFNSDHIVFHLEGNDCIEEFDLDDLIEIVEENEGCQYK